MCSKKIISPGSGFNQLAQEAWRSLKGNWLIAIGAFLIFFVIQLVVSQLRFNGIISWLIYPLTVGTLLFELKLIRHEPLSVGLLFQPFNQYIRFLWGNLRCFIFIFLWSLLLIIPGIIAAYRYAMTPYIMLDDPDCSVKEAMQESSDIMYGHKLQFFGYGILWLLITLPVCIFTLGIGLIWLIPLVGAWSAAFYESIRRRDAFEPESMIGE